MTFTLTSVQIAALQRVKARIAPPPAHLTFEARRAQAKRITVFNRSIPAGIAYARTHRVYMGKPV